MLVNRIFISMFFGILIGLILSEAAFFIIGRTTRPPQIFTITIPLGTAEKVAQGESPIKLPESKIYVVGDQLVVKNEDSVNHQLGPLWIPSQTTGNLSLGRPENLAYECSFEAGNYFELDVREPLTLGTRIYGILFAGIPMGVLIALYAIILPSKKSVKNEDV
jgi:tetrahydromethanopterin S-methyltransferase subunit B